MALQLSILLFLLFSGINNEQIMPLADKSNEQSISFKAANNRGKVYQVEQQPSESKNQGKSNRDKPRASSITKKLNVEGVSLTKRSSEGSRLEVVVMRSGVPVRNLEDFNIMGNSGNPVTSGNYFGMDNINFPFQGNVRFAATNKLNTVKYTREVSFEISEPGYWVLRITI
jgi:hypothetical protein